MQGLPLGPKQKENVVNTIMAQTSKPELAQYLHEALFIPTTASPLKAIKKGFLKMWPGLTEKLIKNTLIKNGYKNGTPSHKTTRVTINQKETS